MLSGEYASVGVVGNSLSSPVLNLLSGLTGAHLALAGNAEAGGRTGPELVAWDSWMRGMGRTSTDGFLELMRVLTDTAGRGRDPASENVAMLGVTAERDGGRLVVVVAGVAGVAGVTGALSVEDREVD